MERFNIRNNEKSNRYADTRRYTGRIVESLGRYADTDAQEETINALAKIARRSGVNLSFGVKVGKYPQTVILDYKYQDNAVRVNRNGSFEIDYEKFGDYRDPDVSVDDFDIDDIKAAFGKLKDGGEPLEESDKPAAQSIEDCQKWVDYDMKVNGKISKETQDIVKKAGFQIIKDQYGDYEVAARDYKD